MKIKISWKMGIYTISDNVYSLIVSAGWQLEMEYYHQLSCIYFRGRFLLRRQIQETRNSIAHTQIWVVGVPLGSWRFQAASSISLFTDPWSNMGRGVLHGRQASRQVVYWLAIRRRRGCLFTCRRRPSKGATSELLAAPFMGGQTNRARARGPSGI